MSYDERILSMGLSSKDDVKTIVTSHPRVFFLDVRSSKEIETDGALTSHPYVNISCTFEDTSALETTDAASLLPVEKDAAIIIFCRSGRRASSAKKTLEGMGYSKVYNAGGLTDMDYL